MNSRSIKIGWVALVVVLVAGWSPTSGDGVQTEASNSTGGLRLAIPHRTVVGDRDVGDRFTDGFETLQFDGREPFTIHKVETVGGNDNVQQVGVLLAGNDRKAGSVQFFEGFPPVDPLVGDPIDPIGQELPARPGKKYPTWELLVGYEIAKAGVWERESLRITYSRGGETHTALLEAGWVICTPDVPDCDASVGIE